MRIGIDIDCVCNNLVDNWIAYLNNKYDLTVKYNDITDYNIKLFYPMLTKDEIFEPLKDDNFWLELIPKSDSIIYLKKLIDDGHEIKLITATDVKSMPIKSKWVINHYPFLNKRDIYMVFDKSWINTDILLDDCIDNLKSDTYTGVCYSQPWNSKYDGLRVNNWIEFYNLINIITR